MSQDFQMIGQPSPALERIAAERQGWQGQSAEPQIEELTDASDFSRYDIRANRQAQGYTIGETPGPISSWAGHTPTPMAGYPVHPVTEAPAPEPKVGDPSHEGRGY